MVKSKVYLGIMASDVTNNHTNWQSALWLGLKISFQSWIQPACQQLLHSCNTWLPAWTDVRRKNTSQEAKRVKLYHAMVITNLLRYWTCNCSNQEKRRIKMKYGSISMMILPLLPCTASHLRLENYPQKNIWNTKTGFPDQRCHWKGERVKQMIQKCQCQCTQMYLNNIDSTCKDDKKYTYSVF